MMEAATEAQEAYADAVSRAREVEQLVRCVPWGMHGCGPPHCIIGGVSMSPLTGIIGRLLRGVAWCAGPSRRCLRCFRTWPPSCSTRARCSTGETPR